eukprot:5452979-Amphidinium_carterae.1
MAILVDGKALSIHQMHSSDENHSPCIVAPSELPNEQLAMRLCTWWSCEVDQQKRTTTRPKAFKTYTSVKAFDGLFGNPIAALAKDGFWAPKYEWLVKDALHCGKPQPHLGVWGVIVLCLIVFGDTAAAFLRCLIQHAAFMGCFISLIWGVNSS